MTTETYDLIIVGSGSGNSIPEYLDGWKIAIVERDVFGGTCLNRGCIPSKMFVLPADVAETVRHAQRLGINASVANIDWVGIRDRVFGLIDPIAAGGEVYRATGSEHITLLRGTARFIGDKTFNVAGPDGSNQTITAPKVLLAAGARPMIPAIPGLADVRYHTSDSIMRLDHFPPRLGIIGGGFIAVEMGHVFSGLGSDVHVFNRSTRLLRHHDAEISDRFTQVFSERVTFHAGCIPDRIEHADHTILVHADGHTHEFDELLVATGRVPNSDLLDAAAGGLELHDDGRVVVDETMATPVEGVWAVGDLANSYQLKHLANAEAKVAFWNLAHPDDLRSTNYAAVPSAVFSDPQVATVGYSESEATMLGIDYAVGRRDYGGTAYGWALIDETSFAKVLVSRSTGLVIGAHIIGPQAATLIQPLIQAMQFGLPAERMAREMYYIHPALTEVVENALLDALE
ncbi:MAG: mycothione reductase [Acidimicrobiales bacterium]